MCLLFLFFFFKLKKDVLDNDAVPSDPVTRRSVLRQLVLPETASTVCSRAVLNVSLLASTISNSTKYQ